MNIELMTPTEAFAELSLLIALGLFVFYILIELLETSWIISTTQHKTGRTAVLTFVSYLTFAVEIGAVVTNYLYILPIALGGTLGAVLVVEHEKRVRPIGK